MLFPSNQSPCILSSPVSLEKSRISHPKISRIPGNRSKTLARPYSANSGHFA
jgi:hypothetical protein